MKPITTKGIIKSGLLNYPDMVREEYMNLQWISLGEFEKAKKKFFRKTRYPGFYCKDVIDNFNECFGVDK